MDLGLTDCDSADCAKAVLAISLTVAAMITIRRSLCAAQSTVGDCVWLNIVLAQLEEPATLRDPVV
jgi:hypothetical protein